MFRLLSSLFAINSVESEWNLHYGAHCYWRDQTYSMFNVTTIKQILNIEPSIDHEDYYHYQIPAYFKSTVTTDWIMDHYDELPRYLKQTTKIMIFEAASIMAANAMCHPRARVGKFDWSDVLQLHNILTTPYSNLLKQKGLEYIGFSLLETE